AIRATPAQAAAAFPSVDLIAATAIPIAGTRHGGTRGAARLLLGGDLAIPALPGQRARTRGSGIEIELSPTLPGALPPGDPARDRTGEIRALVAAVRERITPDLGSGPVSLREAARATAGDCTTFALAYAALAA